MSAKITVKSHPYAVGCVVYQTLEEAQEKVERARALHPESARRINVIDRATGRPAVEPLPCSHPEHEHITKIAHGYLGDHPRGTRLTLCSGCGHVVSAVR